MIVTAAASGTFAVVRIITMMSAGVAMIIRVCRHAVYLLIRILIPLPFLLESAAMTAVEPLYLSEIAVIIYA